MQHSVFFASERCSNSLQASLGMNEVHLWRSMKNGDFTPAITKKRQQRLNICQKEVRMLAPGFEPGSTG